MADNDIINTVVSPVAAVTGGGVSTGTKVIAGIVIAGVICGGAYAIYALSKPKKNSLIIIKKGDTTKKPGTGTLDKTTTKTTTPAVLTKGTTALVSTPAMADSVTDFTEMGTAPFAGWTATTNGVKLGDVPIINQGANVSIYDTNLKSIGSKTIKTAGVYGTVWGLTAAQFYVKLDDKSVDGPDFSGASFIAVEYKDKSNMGGPSSYFSADGLGYNKIIHHKNKW